MPLNCRSINSLTINGRCRKVDFNLELGRPLGPMVDGGHLKLIAKHSKEQQILDLLNQFRRDDPSDDFENIEYEINEPDQYITIKVKFDDLTYRFDGVIPGMDTKAEFKVLSINTIDDVQINITNLRTEINDDYL